MHFLNKLVRSRRSDARHPLLAICRGSRLSFSIRLFLSFIFLFQPFVPPSIQAQSPADEYRVKAAFLYHFAQFVDWPPEVLGSDNRALTFCIVGQTASPGDLESMVEGKQIGPHPIKIIHLQDNENLRACHVLFLHTNDKKRIAFVLAALQNAPVLTVGESDNFVQLGGMIGFCVQDNKIRFDINLLSAQRAGLKISSRLLLLAKSVVGAQGQG